jgi:hypothetical protein
MRSSTRYLSALAVLALGLLSLVWPATAQPGIPSRSVSRAVVHGRDAGVARQEATSFETFARRPATKGAALGEGRAAVPLAPQASFGFDGLADPSSFPSDTTGARGDSFFVAAVNTQVAVYDLNGSQVVAPIQLDALHSDSSGHLAFDPKVVYDQYNDTFVLVYLVQEDAPRLSLIVTVAIPNATASNASTWCSTSFPGDAVPSAPAVWADFPGLGYNDTRVTITTNQFAFPSSTGSFRSSQVMSIDKLALYDCNPPGPTPTVFAGTKTRDDKGRQAFTLRPAETVGSSPGAQLLVSFRPVQGRGDYLTLWRVKPTAAGFALKKASSPTGKASVPPFGTQQGGGLNSPNRWWDTGDARLINAFYDADREELFTAHTVLKNLKPDTQTGGYPEAVNRWYEIDPGTKLRNSVIRRKGLIGGAEVDVGWPSVATDSSGVLFVTYNRASEPRNEFLSAWVSTIQPSSTSDTELLLHAGAATYNAKSGIERWGDYTAINRDPTNGQNIATFNQYAQSTAQWRQFISLVTDN